MEQAASWLSNSHNVEDGCRSSVSDGDGLVGTGGQVGARVALAACGLVGAALYLPVGEGLVRQWWTDPDYSHALLIVPLALYLAWLRRKDLARVPANPSLAGLAIVVAGLAALVAGTLGAEIFLTRASLLCVVAGAIVFFAGPRHLRLMAFPLALLALSIPLPALLQLRITLPLQLLASAGAEAGLTALAIPVLREGNVLVLATGTLQVAEACSGIRSLVSLVAVALVVAQASDRRMGARVAIVAAAIPIAVAINAIRVLITALVAERFGTAVATGAAHEVIGWLLFIGAFLLVLESARRITAARRVPLAMRHA